MFDPAAVHPIKTGITPDKAPGIMANADLNFREVYSILYQIMLNKPNIRHTRGVNINRINDPKMMSIIEIVSPMPRLISPFGIGRNFVLSINASVRDSCTWFMAEAPEARRYTPVAVNSI
jgi:hypothetical protein